MTAPRTHNLFNLFPWFFASVGHYPNTNLLNTKYKIQNTKIEIEIEKLIIIYQENCIIL